MSAEQQNPESALPSEPEQIPSATFDFLGFESMTLAEFGSEAARRRELADLLLPVAQTFQGSLTAELAKRAGEVA